MSNNNNNRQYNSNYSYGQYNENYYLFGRNNYTSPRGNRNWRSPGNYNRDNGGISGRGGWYGSPRLQQYQHGVRNTNNFKNNYSKKHDNKLNLSNKSSDFKNRQQNSFGQLQSANNEKSKKNLESEPIADAVEPANENEKERSKKVEEDVLRLQKLLLYKNSSSVDIDNSLSSSGLDDENELTSEKRESCLTLPTLQLTESDYKEIGAIAGRKEHEEDDDDDGRKEEEDDEGRNEEEEEEDDNDEEREEDAEAVDEKSDSYSKSDDHDNSNEMFEKDNDAFEDCSSRKSDDVILVNNPDRDMVIDISDDPPVTENVSDGQMETPCDALKESSNEGLSNLSDNDVEKHSDGSSAKDTSENGNDSVGKNTTNDDDQTLLNVDDTVVSAIEKSDNVENDAVVSISDEIRENNEDDCMVSCDDGNNEVDKATKIVDGADDENESAAIGNNYLLNFKNESEKIVGYIDRDICKDGKKNTISQENTNVRVMSKQISSLYRSFLKSRRFGTSLTLKDRMLRHKDLLHDNPYLNKHNLSEFKKRIIISTCDETNESDINKDMISELNKEISTERNETVIVEKEADEFMENYGHLLDDNFTIPVDVLKQLGLSDIANEVLNNELLNSSDDNPDVMKNLEFVNGSDDNNEQSNDSHQFLSPASKQVVDSLVDENQSSHHESSPEKSTNCDRATTINDVDMENESDSAYIQMDTNENCTDKNLCYRKSRFPESFTKDQQLVNQGDSTVSTSCDDSTLQQSVVTSMKRFLKSKCNITVQPTKLIKKENSLRVIQDVKVADYFNCVVESALKTADTEVSSDPAILIVQAVVGSVLNICDVDNKVQNKIVSFLDSLNNDNSKSLTKTKQSSDFNVSERDSDLTLSSSRGIEPSFTSIPDSVTSDNLVKQIFSFGKDKCYKKSTQVVSTVFQNQSESSVIREPDKNSEVSNLIAGSSSSNIPKQNEIQAVDTVVSNKNPSLVRSERETQSRSLKLRNEMRTSENVDSSGESTAESSLDGLQNLFNLLITIDKQVASLTQQKMDIYNEIQNNFNVFRKSGINLISNSLLNVNQKSVKGHSSNLLSAITEEGESDTHISVDSDCALSDLNSRQSRKKVRVIKNTEVCSKSRVVRNVSQTRNPQGKFVKEKQVVQQEPTEAKRELRTRSLSSSSNASKRSSNVNNDDSVKRRRSSRLNLNDTSPSIQESENSEINSSSVHNMDEDSDCTSITSSSFTDRDRPLRKKSLINTKIKHCFVDLSTSNPIKESSTLRNIENESEDIKPIGFSRSTRSNSVSREETTVKRSTRDSSVNSDEANEIQINDLLSVQPIDFNLDNSLRVTAVKENQGFLFFGFDDGRIFKMKSEGTLLDHVYSGHEGSVNCLEVYSNILITGSSDCTVIMHRLTGDREWIAALPVEEPVQCLFVRWNTLYVGTKNGKIARYSCVRKVEIGTKVVVGGENDHILAIHATKEGPRKILIVAAKSLPLTIRDANTGLLLRSVSCNDVYYSLAFFSSTPFVYCGTRFHSVAIIDFTTGEKTGELQLGNNVIKVLIKWNLLFTASYNGYIHIYNIKNEELLGRFSVGSVITEMEIWNSKIILTTTQCPMVLNFPEVLKNYLSKNNITY